MKEQFKHLWVFQEKAEKLLHVAMYDAIAEYGYEDFIEGKDYLYAKGTLPVLLVAHVDTVHFGSPPTNIFYDQEQKILWSPDGIGGDDRAGVAGILELLDRGYRPHILLTDGEEKGGIGATQAAKEIYPDDVKFVIELDRKGSEDAVFYSCDNPDFATYIESFGFKTALGSFSDICKICPSWGIAGVNLSTGYYNAHTKSEYVNFVEWEIIIEKVCSMLSSLPEEQFEYIEKKIQAYTYPSYSKKNEMESTGTNCLPPEDYSDESWDKWDEYYREMYGSAYTSVPKPKEKGEIMITKNADIVISFSPEYYSDMFGGTVEQWTGWFLLNGDQIELELEELMFEKAQDFAIDLMTDGEEV